jgi:guanylate kinase
MIKKKTIIISSPSGCGKDTVVRKLLSIFSNSRKVITSTTRQPRVAEIQGINYNFIEKKKFLSMIDNDEFMEWQDVFGELYGIPKQEFLNNNGHSFIILDVLGALRLKKILMDDSILIFLKPPSKEILIERLKNRKTEDQSQIHKRIERYDMEMEMSELFDYVVINDELEKTISEIIEIIENK